MDFYFYFIFSYTGEKNSLPMFVKHTVYGLVYVCIHLAYPCIFQCSSATLGANLTKLGIHMGKKVLHVKQLLK